MLQAVRIGDAQFAIVAFLTEQRRHAHFIRKVAQGRGGAGAHRKPIIHLVAHRGLEQRRRMDVGLPGARLTLLDSVWRQTIPDRPERRN